MSYKTQFGILLLLASSIFHAYADEYQTLELTNKLVQRVVKDVQDDIIKGNVAQPTDLKKFSDVFGNTFSNPIKTSTFYSVTPNQKPYTYIITGTWLAYGPPENNNPANQPQGTMSEMWIRDATAQLHTYLNIFEYKQKYCDSYPDQCDALRSVIEGLVRRCGKMLLKHPTNHAFNQDDDSVPVGLEFELDSPYFFLWLAHDFWQSDKTYNTGQFDDDYFLPAVEAIVSASIKGQSTPILNKTPDVQPNDSKGYWTSFKSIGMISGETRPSDDDQVFPFNLPGNMLAAVELKRLEDVLSKFYPDKITLLKQVNELQKSIRNGIQKYGSTDVTFADGTVSTIYSYETDGNLNLSFISDGETNVYSIPPPSLREKAIGEFLNSLYIEVKTNQKLLQPNSDYTLDIQFYGTNITSSNINFIKPLVKGTKVTVRGYFLLMDDANLPSLLSIPYLGFAKATDKTYVNTRKYILSDQNPYYYVSHDSKFKGIGSPHTSWSLPPIKPRIPDGIWPMSLITQGMTSEDRDEQNALINMLLASAVEAGPTSYGSQIGFHYPDPAYPAVNFMHESFNANNTENFSRGWFAWPNGMFGEWVFNLVSVLSMQLVS